VGVGRNGSPDGTDNRAGHGTADRQTHDILRRKYELIVDHPVAWLAAVGFDKSLSPLTSVGEEFARLPLCFFPSARPVWALVVVSGMMCDPRNSRRSSLEPCSSSEGALR
jgi:hypothetical protein